MSSLSDNDKRYLERVLGMGGGYVLDYTDATFDEFFKRHRVNIHGAKYRTYGTSKAKKMRAFWEQEKDPLVDPRPINRRRERRGNPKARRAEIQSRPA